LLIEDDPGDIELTRESLQTSPLNVRLSVVDDGIKAMDYLYRRGQYADAVTPDLILLDLNLPGKDGRVVLSEVKKANGLRDIPVIALTTSDAEEDIVATSGLGCNCYLIKPKSFSEYSKIAQTIADFMTGQR
jgi:CheY-like chemotaxis protein